MLTTTSLFAHTGSPVTPTDVWSAWNLDPVLLSGLVVTALVYLRIPRTRRPRTTAFMAGLGAILVALVSPLEAMAEALASAHMIQHVALILAAAPLIAFGLPDHFVARASPLRMRKYVGRWRRRMRLTPARLRRLRHPAVLWLAHAAAIWMWHLPGPYGAALDNELVHVIEHATLLATGVLFWRLLVTAARRHVPSPGLGVVLVFTMALQGTLLAALLTFTPVAWYPHYATTAGAWGLSALEDQQLAGVLMWIPGGLVHLGAALSLVAAWLHDDTPFATPRRRISDSTRQHGDLPGAVAGPPRC